MIRTPSRLYVVSDEDECIGIDIDVLDAVMTFANGWKPVPVVGFIFLLGTKEEVMSGKSFLGFPATYLVMMSFVSVFC